MLEFTTDGAAGGPKAIVWTENENNRVPKSPCWQKLVDFQFGVSNIFHKLDQALPISAANSDGE